MHFDVVRHFGSRYRKETYGNVCGANSIAIRRRAFWNSVILFNVDSMALMLWIL